MAEILNEMQERFVNGYLSGKSGKQAAIDAGYSPRTAEAMASRLLRTVKVKAAIDARRKLAMEAAVVDQTWVLSKLKEVVLVNSHLYQKEGFEGPMFNPDGSPLMKMVDAAAANAALKTLAACLQMGKEKGNKDATIETLAETLRSLINGPEHV